MSTPSVTSGLLNNLRINLNQNLWVLIAALITLGFGEYYQLCLTKIFGILLTVTSAISMIFTLVYYTYHYCVDKCYKAKCIKRKSRP